MLGPLRLLVAAPLALLCLAAAPGGAGAADCGDDIGPCSCGDRVVGRKHFSNADPVVRAACPGDALVAADGALLDLNQKVLLGSGGGVGVRIEEGATNPRIRDGFIRGFGTGILAADADQVVVTEMVISKNAGDGIAITGGRASVTSSQILDNGGAGVRLTGDGHRVEKLQVRRNGGDGIALDGNGGTVFSVRVLDSKGAGARLVGDGHSISRAVVQGSGAEAIVIDGHDSQAIQNQAKASGAAGLVVSGANHVIARNVATGNAEDGFLVTATGSLLERNKSQNNGAYGMTDTSAGAGTAGTANVYRLNVCSGNRAGDSAAPSPTENICR